jgi:hypothetical protein
MPRIRGRLQKGSPGFLELSDGVVTLWEERGFWRKTTVKLAEFPVSTATSTQLQMGELPRGRLHRLTIGYGEETEEEAVFLSDDGEALEAVRMEVDINVERRTAARERELAEQRRVREAHVHQVTLLLDLLDEAFLIALELNDGVDWDAMRRALSEMGQILEEMPKVDVETPLDYDLGGLSAALRLRVVEDIKRECHALVSAIHDDAKSIAETGEPQKGFDLRLYDLFVGACLLLWDLRLGEVVGDDLDNVGLERLQAYLDELDGMLSSEDCTATLKQIQYLPSVTTFGPFFNDVRSLIHGYLNSLVE